MVFYEVMEKKNTGILGAGGGQFAVLYGVVR